MDTSLLIIVSKPSATVALLTKRSMILSRTSLVTTANHSVAVARVEANDNPRICKTILKILPGRESVSTL